MNSANVTPEKIKATATMLAALVVLGMFIVALGGHRFWEELNTYVIRFESVQDLRPGRPVKFAGLNVGRVVDIGMDPTHPGRVAVTIGVDSKFELYEGTQASISQKGLVGDNYVLLVLKGDPGPVLKQGANIPSVTTASMAQVAEKIGVLLDDLTPKLTRVASSLDAFVNDRNAQNISDILEKMPKLMAQADRTMKRIENDWRSVSSSAVEGIDQGRVALLDVTEGLDSTLDTINIALVDMSDSWETTMGAMQTEISRAGDNMERVTYGLEDTIEYDQERLEEVLTNMTRMTKDLRNLSRSLRERPWQLIHRTERRPLE